MNKQEATNIKDDILRKEGTVHIGNAITIDGAVLVKDILDIIDKHTEERYGDERNEKRSRIKNKRLEEISE